MDLADGYDPPALPGGATPTTYAYNLDRQLTQITRPDSQTIDFGYDSGGRASTVTVPGGQIGYDYGPTTGNLSSVTGPFAATDSLTFAYDGSLLTGVSWSGAVAGSLAATYDDDFRVTQTTVNGGSAVTFGYDQDGLLDQAGSLAIGRDAANGLIDSTTLGSVTTARAYNGFGEFDEYAAQVSSSDVFRTTYTRDGVGRITQIVETVQGTTRVLDYGYDVAGPSRRGDDRQRGDGHVHVRREREPAPGRTARRDRDGDLRQPGPAPHVRDGDRLRGRRVRAPGGQEGGRQPGAGAPVRGPAQPGGRARRLGPIEASTYGDNDPVGYTAWAIAPSSRVRFRARPSSTSSFTATIAPRTRSLWLTPSVAAVVKSTQS